MGEFERENDETYLLSAMTSLIFVYLRSCPSYLPHGWMWPRFPLWWRDDRAGSFDQWELSIDGNLPATGPEEISNSNYPILGKTRNKEFN